ncbi:MAG: chromo domain-containing protein, partial [Candidatus Thiodiazotropha sp.]
SLNYIAPKDVTKKNEADLWAFMYLKKSKKARHKRQTPFKFKVDDLVRISYLKHPFRRSYQQQYTGEVFKIAKRLRIQGIPIYKLKDWNNELITGNFYSAELNAVSMDSENLFAIEKVLKKRKLGGKTELFVKWLDYPNSMNSWISQDSVESLQK